MPEDSNLLAFDEFLQRTGLSENVVRIALNALKLEPVPLGSDRRKKRYRIEWVQDVRKWAKDNLGVA